MSNHTNHRRGEIRRTESGTYTSSKAVGRRLWKHLGSRSERRTGKTSPNVYGSTKPHHGRQRVLPSDQGDER